MAVTRQEAQAQILDDLAVAINRTELAVACLGEAFEQLTTAPADKLEDELFRPTQKALIAAKRTHRAFAQRVDRPADLHPPTNPPGSTDAKEQIVAAGTAIDQADSALAELQDSMMPIEFGDPELRQGLAEVRELLGGYGVAARLFLRSLGR